MSDKKHIHLIGICGTAMASLAGMLKQRAFHVTGSDAAAYPPMSDFLASLDIPLSQPFAVKNLDPRPDMVVVGNAISRGNVELEHVLDLRAGLRTAEATLRCALERRESRGAHNRTDFPRLDPALQRNFYTRLEGREGPLTVSSEPVPATPEALHWVVTDRELPVAGRLLE